MKKIKVIIEIPKSSSNKYEYDEQEDIIKLDRTLHSPFYYPTDYGFIPKTRSKDNDHLDCMIITENPTFPGCLVEARPLAVLEMSDEAGIDNKILAVPLNNPYYNDYGELDDVPPHLLKEIAHFFQEYKRLEEGKKTKIKGWGSKEKAFAIIKECCKRFKKEKDR